MSIKTAMLENKEINVLGVKADENGTQSTIYGYASVKNVVDLAGDVIVDGAYTDLDKTLSDGFIANCHDHAEPIGYFTMVKEDSHGLYFEAKFHSTEDAQEYFQIISERIAAGKTCTMSIGYKVLDFSYGDFKGENCRILKKIYVAEASFTLTPANGESMLMGVKTRSDQFNTIKEEIASYGERLCEIYQLGRSEAWLHERKSELTQIQNAIDCVNEAIAKFMPDRVLDTTEETPGVSEVKTDELNLIKTKALAIIANIG